ncbi:MAG: ATP-dependent DNA helicase RecG [Lachnospiraceae bacterium]|nr:ATP-dependent DNA helicase RecG [Lachnospiraceae bacterium]
MIKGTDPIRVVKGVGAKTEELMHNLGVYTVGDILSYFPRDYRIMQEPVKIADVKENAVNAILARTASMPRTRKGRRVAVTSCKASDGFREIELVWFRMPYVKNMLTPGKNQIFYGRVIRRGGKLVMEQPVIYAYEEYAQLTGRLLPVYALTKGISNHLMEKLLSQILPEDTAFPQDPYTDELRERNDLVPLPDAIRIMHAPRDMEALSLSHRRLAFDEFFFFLLGIQRLKGAGSAEKNGFTFADSAFLKETAAKLPYALTEAQQRVLTETAGDMKSDHLMQRLIQGDVGSGKTVIAFLLMAWCAHSGYQAALMAPTEVLAKQHFETIQSYLSLCGLSFPVILLTGSMTAKEKREAYARMENEPDALVIGTHALIQEKAAFSSLALVITDEQHRFGVKQREALSKKGEKPHYLVMSATPIPRTLAIILFGDLSISVIDTLPADRLPIKNCVVGPSYRQKAWEFLTSEVEAGHQCYVICPLVEATEQTEAENVEDYAARLTEALPERIRIETLHGRMKAEEKDRVMEAFLRREADILVSTTVVEVGVNVPNATVMLVENAERFGLSQLHQLRGRVGRGEAQSYCIFLSAREDAATNERLSVLNHSNDGFYIASEDLKLRGPGDFLGIRQSGVLDFQIADVYQDASLLSLAAEEVKRLSEADPELSDPAHEGIRQRLDLTLQKQLEGLNL